MREPCTWLLGVMEDPGLRVMGYLPQSLALRNPSYSKEAVMPRHPDVSVP